MVLAENTPELKRLQEIENCDAATYQVGKFLLSEIENLLSGREKKEVVIASYSKPKEGDWFCQMPEEIRLDEELVKVADYQWFFAASWALFQMDFNLHDVLGRLEEGEVKKEEVKVDENGEVKIEVQTLERADDLEKNKFRGELSRLAIEGQFELVVTVKRILPLGEKAREIVEGGEGWQILVRRKVDRIGYNKPKAA